MERYRIKTVIIVILLIINGFLLVLVGARKTESLRYEQSALEGTIQVLSKHGIELAPEVIANRESRQLGVTERSVETEAQIASVLLGENAVGENRGGGLYTYSTQLGELSFRAGGELSVQLAENAVWNADDPVSHSDALMASLQIECHRVRSELSSGSGKIQYVQLLDGSPLFSCQLTFTYEAGRLVSISGNLLAADEPEMESGTVLTLPTVLMRFLDDVISSGDVCSAILAVEPGYLISQSFTSTIQLRPTWYISTNTADYYMDGVTGALTRVME